MNVCYSVFSNSSVREGLANEEKVAELASLKADYDQLQAEAVARRRATKSNLNGSAVEFVPSASSSISQPLASLDGHSVVGRKSPGYDYSAWEAEWSGMSLQPCPPQSSTSTTPKQDHSIYSRRISERTNRMTTRLGKLSIPSSPKLKP